MNPFLTQRVRGSWAVFSGMEVLYKFMTNYGAVIRPLLTSAEQVQWDAILAALHAFLQLFPPGA